jgi:hypothetical protein
LSRLNRQTGQDRGVELVGDREVDWELDESDRVTVTHPLAGVVGEPVRYDVGLVFTDMPCGGARWWWACPACRARVDALYLPADRDRLACRRCCGLAYASQYPSRKLSRRTRRLTVPLVTTWKIWTPATGWKRLSPRTKRR